MENVVNQVMQAVPANPVLTVIRVKLEMPAQTGPMVTKVIVDVKETKVPVHHLIPVFLPEF